METSSIWTNIVDADENVFLMRFECEFSTKNWDLQSLKADFEKRLAIPFNMYWEMYTQEQKPKMALFRFQVRPLFVRLVGALQRRGTAVGNPRNHQQPQRFKVGGRSFFDSVSTTYPLPRKSRKKARKPN